MAEEVGVPVAASERALKVSVKKTIESTSTFITGTGVGVDRDG